MGDSEKSIDPVHALEAAQPPGPDTLTADYQIASDAFIMLQTYCDLVEEQVNLGLPVDAGVAYEASVYQGEMKQKARDFHRQRDSEFIELVAVAMSINDLFQALCSISLPQLRAPDGLSDRLKSVSAELAVVAKESGRTNQKCTTYASDVEIVHSEAAVMNTKLDAALVPAILQLGTEAEASLAEINALKAAIQKNINDIVEGAHKGGAAYNELGVGFLTTIENARAADAAKKKAEAEKGKKDEGKKKGDKKEDKKKDGAKKPDIPSADFVISAIHGAEAGAEETSKARAELNANNKKLAKAYHKLAQQNEFLAIAKVVAVQNGMMADAMKDASTAVSRLAETWGRSPLAPPGSGISLSLQTFAELAGELPNNSEAANLLAEKIDYAGSAWALLGDRLDAIRRRLAGVD
ncbi:MAG: hypothetical protein AAF468_21195 [Pseudomonadota bacterium]